VGVVLVRSSSLHTKDFSNNTVAQEFLVTPEVAAIPEIRNHTDSPSKLGKILNF
jgi:hypothetical protein